MLPCPDNLECIRTVTIFGGPPPGLGLMPVHMYIYMRTVLISSALWKLQDICLLDNSPVVKSIPANASSLNFVASEDVLCSEDDLGSGNVCKQDTP